jgi:hypothetical protein
MKGGENTISLPGPEIPWPPPVRGKWEREYQAFLRLRSQLMETHKGLYVAVHDEQVIDCDKDSLALTLRVLERIGNVEVHVGLITDQPEPVFRSGVIRALSPQEAL